MASQYAENVGRYIEMALNGWEFGKDDKMYHPNFPQGLVYARALLLQEAIDNKKPLHECPFCCIDMDTACKKCGFGETITLQEYDEPGINQMSENAINVAQILCDLVYHSDSTCVDDTSSVTSPSEGVAKFTMNKYKDVIVPGKVGPASRQPVGHVVYTVTVTAEWIPYEE